MRNGIVLETVLTEVASTILLPYVVALAGVSACVAIAESSKDVMGGLRIIAVGALFNPKAVIVVAKETLNFGWLPRHPFS